jgi:putative transposase
VARRNTKTNLANISYDKIQEYVCIERTKIKPAISFLASLELIFVEHIPSEVHESGVTNAYRIVGIDSYKHMGTQGRGMTAYDYGQPETDDIDIPF